MRSEEEKLRKCPTCGSDTAADLGLRNYAWLNDQLPGKVGGMDIDMVLERKGHVLGLEFKPKGAGLSLGARITFRTLARKPNVYIWVVWELGKDDKGVAHVEVGALDTRGEVPFVERMTLARFITKVTEWYKAADEGEL